MLLWCGCPSPPKKLDRVTPIPPRDSATITQTPTPAASPAAQPAPQPEEHPEPEPEQAPFYAPPPQLPAGAVALDLWGREAALPRPLISNGTTPPSATLQTPRGTLQLFAGSRFASWNQTLIGLGFAPNFKEGRFYVHSTDIQKNLHPLITRDVAVQKDNKVVVIDPGHGGQNTGARLSQKNIFEKDLALDWALRLERLMAGSAWHVVLTRRDDRDVSLLERAAIADAVEADLFISLHFNSVGGANGAQQHGLETYCLTPTGMPSNLVREFEDDISRIFPNNVFDDENLLFGLRIHQALLQATGRKDRGVRRARFMTVIREQRRPAILLEGGFLSNPEEAKLIGQENFRELLARGVAKALAEL